MAATFSSRSTAAGIRAKAENSLISRPMVSTWRMMVAIEAAKDSRPSWICAEYFRSSRSADRRIGVSGFLTSCAIRRATSAQAACRCADRSTVMSSKVTM